ncbi:nucleotidyltransferase domain-containing protein [Haloprofundus sp. MHR1]|uniref:nucleotidyltransferase domain-containing protein n=1 Tax=Haloprofundus sp. MHR1 TaxID=2572921 RepID=UPI0010BF340A|nr:nucleotidyltransferase domain-containing protein [Haloprofundus sp. MHR1]QCJ45986.1 HTH domain-containing protein [Haloprofundus sp. MHR1]
MSDETKQGIKVCVRVHPGSETKIFRLRAADDILRILVDAHESEFTIKELASETDHSRSTIWRAIELLDELEVISIRETAQRNYISINPATLQKDDPILAIEQTEYHEPIRAFVNRVEAAVDNEDKIDRLLGVLVFGSVARGEADRKSDIDVFVLVDGDRTIARRTVSTIITELSEEQFSGDRYTFESFVESLESAQRASGKLQELFQEGVTVFGSQAFQQVRKEVLSNERQSN